MLTLNKLRTKDFSNLKLKRIRKFAAQYSENTDFTPVKTWINKWSNCLWLLKCFKSRNFYYVLYSWYTKSYFCYMFHIYVICFIIYLLYIFMYIIRFFMFCYTFLFSHYLILNSLDKVIFTVCTKLLECKILL